MKQDIMKFKFIYIVLLVILSFGCENQDNEFDDFTEQNVYFPIQYPVRTISLQEDSRIDNSIDLERAFSIGVALGGVRENTVNRTVNVAIDESLVDGVVIDNSDRGFPDVLLMPSNYYSLSSTEITIPAGSFSGTIRVELTDAFFQDPLAVGVNYVIPLVITGADSSVGILTGTVANSFEGTPDRRDPSHWETGETPKDFTIFAVKFINKYHGIYLHKGQDDTLDGQGGSVVSSDVYSTSFITDNLLTTLATSSLNTVVVDRIARNTGAQYQMVLTIDGSNNVTISPVDGGYSVSGGGTFVERENQNAEEWGGESRKTFFLDYEYEAEGVYHSVKDTLVFRNDDLKFEEFNISITD